MSAQSPTSHSKSSFEDALLEELLAVHKDLQRNSDDVAGDDRFLVRHNRRTRHLAGGLAGAAAAVVVVAGAIALVGAVDHSPSVHRTQVSQPTSTKGPTGPTMRLSSYRFKLPAGFKTVAGHCASAPTIPATGSLPAPTTGPSEATAVTPFEAFAAAASADGGCIEAEFARTEGAIIPSGAQPVEVGPYQGFITSDSATGVVNLYVELVGGTDNTTLILTATGLSSDQVIAIAESGLPTSTSPAP